MPDVAPQAKFGKLKITTSIWPEVPLAGSRLTSVIQIENHFDSPVKILDIDAVLPAGLVAVKSMEDKEAEKKAKAAEKKAAALAGSSGLGWLSRLSQQVMPCSEIAPQLLKAGTGTGSKPEATLQPGDSTVQNSFFRSRHWLLTMPAKHHLDFRVKYELEGKSHEEAVPLDFQLRPPMRSVIVGAVGGGVVGAFVRELSRDSPTWDFPTVVRMVLAIPLSGIGVIFLTRKGGVQTLPVSVEDFWGGLLVGFLVGYLGNQFFQQTLLPTTPGAGVTPTPTPPPS